MNLAKKCTLLLTIVATLASARANSASNDEALSARVDAAVRQQMKDQKIPGLSIAVVRSGKIIKAMGYGLANVEVKWNYSNPGYQMLGFLIHRVTGKYYGDFFREHFFMPLGMATTTVFSYANIVPNRASGYDLVNGVWKNTPLWQSVSTLSNAEGSLLMSVLDLAKWDAGLNTEQILKRSSLEAMWTPVPIDDGSAYPAGMGWFIANARGHRVVFHTGGGSGFYADISRYLDDRLTIIVMTNIDEARTDVLKVAGDIAAIYLPDTKGANPIKDWQD
jgi:CubicO group peptidase (beta-lactamase class C family)